MTSRISIRDEPSISLPPREEVERLLALTTPPPSPLTPLSSLLPQIPSPPPNSPTHIEIPESCLPLWKKVRFASLTPSHEVGESSVAGAARQDRPAIAREDPYSIARKDLYGFVDMVDVPPRCSMSRELDYDITDTWDDLVGAIDEIALTTVEGVNQRVPLDRPVHHRLAVMIEREAKMAREAWGLSMDASDYARSDVMSLRTTDTRIRRVQKEAKDSKLKPEKSNPQPNPVNLDNSTNNVLIPLDSWTSGLLEYKLLLSREDCGLDSNEDEVVPKVDEVSLNDRVFDGAFGGDIDKDVVIRDGVGVT
ncbi:hypothetical protein Tco_0065638 [Tanacetum coccineum]